mmetsp:Transcript_23262/g.54004  ORF Transcript_23262/g.54004 Transcript_23262/m.54004 type:complete len:240 (+) Transcript_23262:1-720(+)
MKAQLDGTHTYAALASSTSSSAGAVAVDGCVAGAPSTATVASGSGGADAQYDRTTGTVTAVVCEAGIYHLQFMQPSLVNRALPPPGQEANDPVVVPTAMQGWAIALIAIGAVALVAVVVGAVYVIRRSNRPVVTPHGVAPSGAVIPSRSGYDERNVHDPHYVASSRSPAERMARLSAAAERDDAPMMASDAIVNRQARRQKRDVESRRRSAQDATRVAVGSAEGRPDSAEEAVEAMFRD